MLSTLAFSKIWKEMKNCTRTEMRLKTNGSLHHFQDLKLGLHVSFGYKRRLLMTNTRLNEQMMLQI